MSDEAKTAENTSRRSMLTMSKCAALDLGGDDTDDFLAPRPKPVPQKLEAPAEEEKKKKKKKESKKKRSKHKGKGRRRHHSRTETETETKAETPQGPTGPTGPRVNALVLQETEENPLAKAAGATDDSKRTKVVVKPDPEVVVTDDSEYSDSDDEDYEDFDEDTIQRQGSNNELARMGLTKSQAARAEAHAHAMAEYVIVDTSFLATAAFDVFLEMKGVWWGPNTDRTLVVQSCTFLELEAILRGELSPDGAPIPRLALALHHLNRLMKQNELIRLDVDEVMDQIYEAYGLPVRPLLTTTFKMGCVLMERRIEQCPVPCLLSVLTRDPAFRVALSTFNKEAIEMGTITRQWLYEKEPCWCPVQIRDGTCPGGACPYVHRENPDTLVRDAHPQCPKETLGGICEDKACPWRHTKRVDAEAAPATAAAEEPAPAPAESGPKKPSYMKEKPAGHRRNASVIVMKVPSYLAKKGQKPGAKKTEEPKKPSADLLKPTVTQIVTGKNAVLEMSRMKAEARAIENATHLANYCQLIEGLSKLQFKQFQLAQKKKEEGVVTNGCDEKEWDDY